MKCNRIKKLLPLYCDGQLDESTKRLVEKHIATCDACSNELASLKRIAQGIETLSQEKAPQGFLEALHERIERSSSLKERILHSLFFPAWKKIPLECAGVLVTAVLVIFIARSINLDTRSKQMPALLSERAKAEDEPALERVEPEVQEETEAPDMDKPKVEPGQTMPSYSLQAKPPLKKRLEEKEEVFSVEDEVKDAHVIELSLLLKTPPSVTSHAAKRSGALDISENEGMGKKAFQAKEEAPPKGMAKETAIDSIDRIMASIQAVKGSYISTDYDEAKDRPAYLIADIPSEHYQTFIDSLKGIGGVLEPLYQGSPTTQNKRIRVKIRIVYPIQ